MLIPENSLDQTGSSAGGGTVQWQPGRQDHNWLRHDSGNVSAPGTDWQVPAQVPLHKNHSSHQQFTQSISGKVLQGELDFGVVGAKWRESGLMWTRMFHDELTLAVHPEHPWADRKHVSLNEVMQEPFILRKPESGTRKVFSRILAENGLRDNDLLEVAEIGSTAAIKEAVKAGIGVSILSRCALRDEINCGRLVAVAIQDQPLERSFYLVQRKNRKMSPVVSVFIEYLSGNEV